MKSCSKCKENKCDEDFAFKNKKLKILQPYCRSCQRTYRRNHYQKNKDKYILKVKIRRKNLVHKYKDYKNNLICKLCGESESCCLEFHHTDNNKEGNISQLITNNGWSWNAVKLEIDKCVVVCANCHRKIHAGIAQLVEH